MQSLPVSIGGEQCTAQDGCCIDGLIFALTPFILNGQRYKENDSIIFHRARFSDRAFGGGVRQTRRRRFPARFPAGFFLPQ